MQHQREQIVFMRGLCAVLGLLASTPGAFAQIATAQNGQLSYTVDGLALGERVQSNNAVYRAYKCGPSDHDAFTWCQKAHQQKEPRRSFNVTYSLLHSREGEVVYANRYQTPAFFGPNEADEEIQRYSRRLGASPRIIKMPHRPGMPDGILATWGNVELKPLDSESIASFRKGSANGGTTTANSKKRYFVDFIGNFARSAKRGLPIYRISGGAGAIWVASFNQKGRGTLRIAAVDASAFYPEMLPTAQEGKTQNSDARRAPALAGASTKNVSRQPAAEKTTGDGQVAGQPTRSAEHDAQLAQTEMERVNAERAQLNAAIRWLAADKAAAEAKAYAMETTAYGAIIILLIVLAGAGALVFVGRKKGPAGKHPSVKFETKELPPTELADITKIELETAGDRRQPDLQAAYSIASSSTAKTKELSFTEPTEIIKTETPTRGDPLQPSSIGSPSSRLAHVSASVRGLGALTGIIIVGTLSAGAIAAVLFVKTANPYREASRVIEPKDIPWEFRTRMNDMTNKMEPFVVGWQGNQQGAGAEIVGECVNRNIIFKATALGRDAISNVEFLWDHKLEDYRSSIGEFREVIYLPILVKVNDNETEVIKRLQEGAYRNVIRLATFQLDPTPAPPRLAQLDDNMSMAERTSLASYYPEKIFNIAEVRVITMQLKTSEGTMRVKIMMHDAAIRKLVQACQT